MVAEEGCHAERSSGHPLGGITTVVGLGSPAASWWSGEVEAQQTSEQAKNVILFIGIGWAVLIHEGTRLLVIATALRLLGYQER